MKTKPTILPVLLFFLAAFLLCAAPTRAQMGAPTHPQMGEQVEKDIPYYISHAPFPMPVIAAPVIADRRYGVLDYGAVGDGQTMNTASFEKAIAACSAAGGGKVIIPAGLWLTGPIAMRSNIDLHLERGALVIFTKDVAQYTMTAGPGGGNKLLIRSPLYGINLSDIAITGEGILDGGGDAWRPVKKSKTTEAQWKNLLRSGGALSKDGEIWWPSREAMEGDRRPYMVYFVNCHRVLVEGVTIRNSPKFVFYPNNCTDLTMSRVNIFNEWWAQNGDGIDISACRNVIIYRCNVSAGDDGICMKSSGGRSGAVSPGAATAGGEPGHALLENVIVAGCNVYHAHGGFVIGSNTDGGVHNIAVSDCNFIGTDVGLRFKSNMGRGGLVSDIYVRDIFMRDIVNEAVLFDTYYEDSPAGSVKDASKPKPQDKTPEFRDFHISRIFCSGAGTAIVLTGLPQMAIGNILFDSVEISSGRGLIATQAKKIRLSHSSLITAEKPEVQADKTAEVLVTE